MYKHYYEGKQYLEGLIVEYMKYSPVSPNRGIVQYGEHKFAYQGPDTVEKLHIDPIETADSSFKRQTQFKNHTN